SHLRERWDWYFGRTGNEAGRLVGAEEHIHRRTSVRAIACGVFQRLQHTPVQSPERDAREFGLRANLSSGNSRHVLAALAADSALSDALLVSAGADACAASITRCRFRSGEPGRGSSLPAR